MSRHGLLLLIAFFMAAPASAADKTAAVTMPPPAKASVPSAELPVVTLEETKGTVSSVSPTSIAVLYETKGSEEFEIMIPIDPKAKLEGYKKRSEIKPGDTVKLKYEKTVTAPGRPEQKISMKAKVISFIKRASNALTSEEGAT